MSAKFLDYLRRHHIALLALFVALGGSSYAAATGSIDSREIKNNTVRSKDIRNNEVRSRDVRNGSLLSGDFKAGQLPVGPQGERGPQGPRGLQGLRGANGATNVAVRFSGRGFIVNGTQAAGADGGVGGLALCDETGCVLATGGDGGNAGSGGTGGAGGNATCGPGCNATGGSAGNAAGGPDSGEGGTVGLRASCAAGERAVGGGVQASDRDALTYTSQPATSSSTTPNAGDTPTAWYVETYNQSRAGEGRDGEQITVRAYVVCGAP
jgi:hypothetical protein